MKNAILILLFFSLMFISCRNTKKSNELLSQSQDWYYSMVEYDSAKAHKSLELVDEALKLDPENIAALNHKLAILFIEKDIKGMLQISDKLIDLKPEMPGYLGQKALYLELLGDTAEALKYYQESIKMYQNYIENEKSDFDLLLEYLGILEISGDTVQANQTLNEMKKMEFEPYQLEILDNYKRQELSKDRLKKYWKGEIEYNQIMEEK